MKQVRVRAWDGDGKRGEGFVWGGRGRGQWWAAVGPQCRGAVCSAAEAGVHLRGAGRRKLGKGGIREGQCLPGVWRVGWLGHISMAEGWGEEIGALDHVTARGGCTSSLLCLPTSAGSPAYLPECLPSVHRSLGAGCCPHFSGQDGGGRVRVCYGPQVHRGWGNVFPCANVCRS